MNGDDVTVDAQPNAANEMQHGDSFPHVPLLCKAPKSGSVGTHPSPDGLNVSTIVKADVAPRGLGVLITHTNSLANSPKEGGGVEWR